MSDLNKVLLYLSLQLKQIYYYKSELNAFVITMQTADI